MALLRIAIALMVTFSCTHAASFVMEYADQRGAHLMAGLVFAGLMCIMLTVAWWAARGLEDIDND